MHSVAVCALMVALARELGMDAPACREAGLAGLLHDVGKALMPLDVLNKPGKLSEAEFVVMRSHPLRGHELLVEGGSAGAAALDVCLHHHERVDGSGYPHGLKGDAIARAARMGAICDVYDAISSTRPYKAAWDPADSLSRMASWDGHFDPPLFAAFVRSLGIYPTGSLVRLRSGRLAVVVKQDSKNLTAPTVKVFFSTKSNMPTAVTQIDLARPDASDAILAREPRGQWNFPQLETLWAGEAATRR
jgi:HD-GYP domain-containing protein (c-di-GMP phosphodiesterase class II)